jgi:hypothetical protein
MGFAAAPSATEVSAPSATEVSAPSATEVSETRTDWTSATEARKALSSQEPKAPPAAPASSAVDERMAASAFLPSRAAVGTVTPKSAVASLKDAAREEGHQVGISIACSQMSRLQNSKPLKVEYKTQKK